MFSFYFLNVSSVWGCQTDVKHICVVYSWLVFLMACKSDFAPETALQCNEDPKLTISWRYGLSVYYKRVQVAKKMVPYISVVCLIFGFSISLSICLVTLLRSFCRSLACLYFSLNLRAASGSKTHLCPSQCAHALGLPIGRMGTLSPAP